MKGGTSALHVAAQNGHLSIVEWLTEKCCSDVNVRGNVSCHLAHILQITCNYQHADTPLHLAALSGHLNVVEYLIEQAGADVNAGTNVSHHTLSQVNAS